RGARASRVRDAFVGAVVLVFPNRLAVSGAKAENPLDLGGLGLSIGHVDAAVGHRRAAVTGADFSAPLDIQLRLVEFLPHAGFAPHAIAIRATPLRPIVGLAKRRYS